MTPEEVEHRRALAAWQFAPVGADERAAALEALTPEQVEFAEALAGPGWREKWFSSDLPRVVELFG